MRYSRQIIFDHIGEKGQELLKKSTVTILGLGATGSNSAQLLARAGIGKLILIDRDIVELHNLQRQSLFTEQDLYKSKAIAAKQNLEKINSSIKILAHFTDIDYINIKSYVKGDLVLDCTDNMESRFLLNEFSIVTNIPWIYSAVIGSSGYVFNRIPNKTPCLKCIFNEPTEQLGTCDTEGILNSIPSLIASIQVTEAIKILTHQPSTKELLYYDIWKQRLIKTKVKKNPSCPTCNKKFVYLTGEKYNEVIKLCGTNSFQLRCPKLNLEEAARKLEKIDKVNLNEYCLIFRELTIFRDGRALVKADSPEKAKSLYSSYIGN